jgi:polyisoprenoid-binding protein YceI
VQLALLAIMASDRSHRVFVASAAQSRDTQSPTDIIMSITRNRTIFSTLALSLTLVSVSACKSEVDEKPKAKVEEAEKKPVEKVDDKAPQVVTKTLALAAEGSSVGFIGAKLTGDHKGGFEKFSGNATVADGKLVSMSVVIEMDSMTSDSPDLTGHLKNADFFNVPEHPQAKFESLSITEKSGEKGATHEIAGNLELKGEAKKVTFPATIEVSDAGVHGKAEFSINRKDWKIDYPGKPDDLIKDDVALILDLNFK